jgi:protoporphyrinogen oxidase
MTTRHVHHLIIGAGPAGLGAAYRLKELGRTDFHIVESNRWVGGLASSFVDDHGFTWDIGGHVQFSHYPYFDAVMDRALGVDGWLHHQRESWVWMKNRFVPYPFQNNIRYLPKESIWRCLEGIIEITKNPRPRPTNFKEWVLAVFGAGIAAEFMSPYNFKVWAYPLEEMAFQWIGERVSVVDLNRVAQNVILERDDLSWGPNNLFRFPLRGGTGAIWRSVGEMVGTENITLERHIVGIEPEAKRALLDDGSTITYSHLLSTIPLDKLAGLVRGFPVELRDTAQRLKHSTSNIIGVGIRGRPSPALATKCWMYFPEDNCPFYRVTLFSKYSPYNVPDASVYFSLMTETSESPAKPVNAATITDETIAGLRATGLLEPYHEVVSTWTYRAEYGYPTPSLERDAILDRVVPALEAHCIYSRGRFGGWKYEVSNQDHTFMQGVEWANFIVQGTPETTLIINRTGINSTGVNSTGAPAKSS